jgi:LPS-assembly lipoprotein
MRRAALGMLCAAALLSACGFRLAGLRPLPAQLRSVYIDTVTPYRVTEPPVETALRAILRRRGGEVTGKLNEAATVLRLSELRESRDVLSVGLDSKAIEYQLVTSVRYELIGGGKALVPSDTLTASRDYSFQPQQVLAKEAEEARLRENIQSELAELIMLRLEAQLTRPPAAAPAASADGAPPAP